MAVLTALAWLELGKIPRKSHFIDLARNFYAFYEGWVIVSLNLNFGILVKYWWKSSNGVQLIIFWILILTLPYLGMLGAYVK